VKAPTQVAAAIDLVCAAGRVGDLLTDPTPQIGREAFDLASASTLAGAGALFLGCLCNVRLAHVLREETTLAMQWFVEKPLERADGRNLSAVLSAVQLIPHLRVPGRSHVLPLPGLDEGI
jgi:hypothetical protein